MRLKIYKMAVRVWHGLVPLIQNMQNYIFKHFVKDVEVTFLKLRTILKLLTLHLEQTIVQVKNANYPNAHAQTLVVINGEMATVSTCFRKLKFWICLL